MARCYLPPPLGNTQSESGKSRALEVRLVRGVQVPNLDLCLRFYDGFGYLNVNAITCENIQQIERSFFVFVMRA